MTITIDPTDLPCSKKQGEKDLLPEAKKTLLIKELGLGHLPLFFENLKACRKQTSHSYCAPE